MNKKALALALFSAVFFTAIYSYAGAFDLGGITDKLRRIKEANLVLLEAKYYNKLSKDIVQCVLCPNKCVLTNGSKGICGSRININGKLMSLVYSNPVAVHVDPIEKKPLSHVLPGTPTFSIACAGCNLRCVFCQNWSIAQAEPESTPFNVLFPKDVVASALKYKCPSVSFTYTEPVIFYEYMLETSKLARKAGLKTVFHSNGYINEEPLKELLKVTDAAVIDLKGFSDEFYMSMTKGKLQPVLDTLKTINKSGTWLEIVNLVIPGKNDDPKMIRAMCKWIVKELGPDVPLHFAAFFPMHMLKDVPPTPKSTIDMAVSVAREEGLKYVYVGNVYGSADESTYCPRCRHLVIKRSGYRAQDLNITKNGNCGTCGLKIPGVWK